MKIYDRSYAEEAGDFVRLCRFVVAERDHVRRCSTWCLGRVVDWKYGLYDSKLAEPAFCDRNAHLWLDAFGDLVAFAVSESGDADFAIITAPGYRFLYGQILEWALGAWGGRAPRPSTEVTEHQDMEIAALERRGFRRAAEFATRRFDLSRPLPEPRIEPGFQIVDMQSHPDYRPQRVLRSDGFHGELPGEDQIRRDVLMTNYSAGGPIYHAETDVCVMAPDGRFASGCEALIDARNLEADIERVCTHSAFRRRGFARAAILACMARLRAMGMRSAYITGYSDAALALYGSLGHVEEKRCFVYELEWLCKSATGRARSSQGWSAGRRG